MEKRKILVVDDEKHIRMLYQEELEEEGYAVATSDGEEPILDLLDRERPDVVVLDIGMPGGDGHTVANRLKNDPLTMFTPIVFLTARTNQNDFELARLNRVDKYLVKPFQVDELVLAVEELVERSQQSAAV